jgi:UDP-N-acetylglucosamine--N-acetylmuramyl-(pentapeptide) pyrophosphoryl-undecaprenol N-acetylglucosamine transferase
MLYNLRFPNVLLSHITEKTDKMTVQTGKREIVIAAGGTGGHIFPALSVALQIRKGRNDVNILWVGTTRSREVELCRRKGIPIVILDVAGIERKISGKAVSAAFNFVMEFFNMRSLFVKNRPVAVIAFGGYVCAPVLAAARLLGIPYFIHEQNTVAGLVNRMFAKGAKVFFAGMPLVGKKNMFEKVTITGTPVRIRSDNYDDAVYPDGFDASKKTILICGGSQGAQSMNRYLVNPVMHWLETGFQVIWQTGNAGYDEVDSVMNSRSSVFVFPTIDDLYPFYAAADIVVGRAGASTLAEIACFGLPCVVIPLPWATENHQWINAGVVASQGWGVRIKQDERCSKGVDVAVMHILTDKNTSDLMKGKALSNSPVDAAEKIVDSVFNEVGL